MGNVDFSSGQGGQGELRRRSGATPHKSEPKANAGMAEKRRSPYSPKYVYDTSALSSSSRK